jgi:hypothetical protein
MVDPNWFYSTLAQSSAAIIGLAGGFMFTRVIAQRSELGDARVLLRGRFNILNSELVNLRDMATAILDSVNEQEPLVKSLRALDGMKIRTFSHQFDDPTNYAVGEQEFVAVEELQRVAREFITGCDLVARLPDELARRLRAGDKLSKLLPTWLLNAPPDPFGGGNMLQELPRQREWAAVRFRTFSAQYNGLLRETEELRNSISVSTLVGLLFVVFVFLALCVVWPMAYLSARSGSTKSLILVAFSTLSAVFLIYLANEVRRLWRGLLLHRATF